MKFEHVIITRFSFRGKEAFQRQKISKQPLWRIYSDPLKPENIKLRFKLFEVSCLPSIKNQFNQNFKWIFIIDKQLNEQYRYKLKELTSWKKEIILHIYNPEEDLEINDWIKQYLSNNIDYLLTTNIDDDDAIPVNFTESIQNHTQQLLNSKRMPPYITMASTNALQWDFIHSKNAPYGWISDWHRKLETVSCGFSFLCKYPEFNYNVLGLNHGCAENYFNLEEEPKTKNVKLYRGLLKVDQSIKNKFDNPGSLLFYDFSKKTGPVLMVNHLNNVQVWRLYESKKNCIRLSKPNDLPNKIQLDWVKLNQYAKSFSKIKTFKNLAKIFLIKKYRIKKYTTLRETLIGIKELNIWFLSR